MIFPAKPGKTIGNKEHGISIKAFIHRAPDHGLGILRLAPNWVPRSFCNAMGADRGGIDERWLASTTPADNGPKTFPNEGVPIGR